MSLSSRRRSRYISRMGRIKRIVVPGIPHHVTQRGTRRQNTFYSEGDYQYYLKLMTVLAREYNVSIDAYCLMPNHVHMIVTPPSKEAIVRFMGTLSQRYATFVNARKKWKGHLWQERFFSTPLSERHAEIAIQYVEHNPLRAGLAKTIREYPWVSRRSLENFLDVDGVLVNELVDEVREMTKTGRPRGAEDFLQQIKRQTGVDPRPRKRGRPRGAGLSKILEN